MQLARHFALVPFLALAPAQAAPQEPPGGAEAQQLVTLVEGYVVTPDGTPVRDAVVVSSAGGSAVTDAEGRFRLALELPADARALRVNAFGAGGADLAASVELVITPLADRLDAGTLELVTGMDCDPEWLPTFGGYPGIPSYVSGMIVFDDGSGDGPALYVGSSSTIAGGVLVNRIARWDGETWSPLGGGLSFDVFCLEVYDDGNGAALYVGGFFTMAGGAPANRIAKWDGTTWSALGQGTDGIVSTLEVFDDGSGGGPALYAAGHFDTAGGIPSPGIARWDGVSWASVGGGVDTGTSVRALGVFDDGSGAGAALYAGGFFSSIGGVAAANLARWDGVSWTPVGGGTNSSVSALEVYDDGTGGGAQLYVGGSFTQAGGLPASRIARWDGNAWSDVGSGMDDRVSVLYGFDEGSGSGPALYAGGEFSSAGGVSAKALAKWDGSAWSPLGSGLNGGNPRVFIAAGFDDGRGGGPRLYVGGFFLGAGGQLAPNIARWGGAEWSRLTDGLYFEVKDVAAFDDGAGVALYAAGRYAGPGPSFHSGVARWDGGSWQLVSAEADYSVNCLVVHEDSVGPALYAGGSFTSIGGVPMNRIARWDGANWTPLGSGLNGGANALCVYDDGDGPELYVGGSFTSAGGVSANRIARWDGNAWNSLGMGCDDQVRALTTFEFNGRVALYAGGDFLSAGGVPAYCIARWNGQSWRDVGVGMGGPVFALEVFDDGAGEALYAGGRFPSAGHVPVSYVAKWDGAGWSALGSGMNDWVRSLASHDDGSGAEPALYAGGQFTTAGGVAASRIAKWDGNAWSPLGAGVILDVNALLSLDDGNTPALYVAGGFVASPSGDSFIAKWGCPGGPGTAWCACDGSGAAAPCGNEAAADEGCANSTGAGAMLSAEGSASVSADDLVLVATSMLPGQPALLFAGSQQVNGGDGLPFGDGLRCAGGSVRRLGPESPDATGAASWGPGLATSAGFAAGETKHLQVWYRDPAGSPCGTGFNLTNGYEVKFVR